MLTTDPETGKSRSDRADEIQRMLASVPVEMLERTVLQLLGATRHVSMGRDRDPVKEPDNAVRLRVLELIVEQGAGAAPSRKPIEAKPASEADKAPPGVLRDGKGKK